MEKQQCFECCSRPPPGDLCGSSRCPEMTVPASFPHSITVCLTPKHRLLSHLHLAQCCGSALKLQAAPRHWEPTPCQAQRAGETSLPFPSAYGDGHSSPEVQCMLLHVRSKGGTFLLTFPPSHLPTGCLTLLPMCPVAPFNPLPQRSHPWVQQRLKPLHQPFY